MDLRAAAVLVGPSSYPTTMRALPRARECECPFVNRADARCSAHLSLSEMGFAYDHCFDEYTSCSVYAELQEERLTDLTIRGRRASYAA